MRTEGGRKWLGRHRSVSRKVVIERFAVFPGAGGRRLRCERSIESLPGMEEVLRDVTAAGGHYGGVAVSSRGTGVRVVLYAQRASG
jgi:hypothetical protein